MITIIIGRAAQFILALAMLRVATTLLSPEEMGKVSLALTTIAFFAMFLVNPVGMFINRRLHAWQASGSARAYLERYAGYLIGVALLAAISLPLFNLSGLVNFGMPIGWIVALVCASLIFNTINQTSIPSLNMLGDARGFVALSVATLAASFVCAVTLVETMQTSAQYWVLGLLLGQMLLAVVGTQMLFAKLGLHGVPATATPGIRGRHLQVLFDFAWPVALAAGLGWVQLQGYRYIMESHLGMAQLGLFVAGYSISAGMIAGFESILTAYFQPRLYRDANKDHPAEQAQAWRRYASAVIPSLILTVAMIVLLAPEFTRILLGERFQGAASFVVWGALAEAARVLAGVYSLIAHVYMRTRWLIVPTAVGATLSIVLCVLLIPPLGAQGAGIALASAGFVVVALLHILLAHRAGGSVPLQALGQAALAAVVLCVAALGMRALFNTADWAVVISVIVITGLVYLGLLYRLLRQHLVEMREA
ncbi:MAG: polysaccharide biosynthesis C-terminal domain-containing protein [Pseudomonadota bacterium]